MLKLNELLESARNVIKEERTFNSRELIIPGCYNLGKLDHGARGDTYIGGRVIIDKGDVDDIIKKELDFTVKQENIGYLKRAIESRTRGGDEDKKTNKKDVEIATKLLEDLQKLIIKVQPGHNREELRKLGGLSELELVVLKWLDKSEYLGKPIAKEAMEEEIKLLSRMNSQKVARYIATVVHEKGIGYLVEYVDGRNFASIIKDVEIVSVNPMTPKPVVFAVAYNLFDALADVHATNATHQDIKPSNIMLSFEGDFKLIDFGLALEFIPGGENVINKIRTDLRYAAPEVLVQIEKGKPGSGSKISPLTDEKGNVIAKIPHNTKTDVYMAGNTIYEVCTGKVPFRQPDFDDFKKEVMEHEPTPINHYNKEITKKESDMLLLALKKDASKRPEAAEFRDMYFHHLAKLGYDTPHKIKELSRGNIKPILDKRTREFQTQSSEKTEFLPTDFSESVLQ